MGTYVRLDKALSPYLFKAIDAARRSKLTLTRKYDLENFHILFEDTVHQNNGRQYYTISFYATEVTPDNWMDASPQSHGGVNVDIDLDTLEIIQIYGDR